MYMYMQYTCICTCSIHVQVHAVYMYIMRCKTYNCFSLADSEEDERRIKLTSAQLRSTLTIREMLESGLLLLMLLLLLLLNNYY